jgi:hypothetical protein
LRARERFIQTLLRECAYAIAYPSSAHRTAALTRWRRYYNWQSNPQCAQSTTAYQQSRRQDGLLRLHI